MLEVLQNQQGRWIIIHGGKEIAEDFDSEAAAWRWADENIDDQVFCRPNRYSPPLHYRRNVMQ